MIRLALAGKCGARGASGSAVCAPTKPPRPTIPKPEPIVLSMSRRVMSVHPLKFIGVEQHAGIFVPIALREERKRQVQFFGGGGASKQETVRLADAVSVVAAQAFRQGACLRFD